MGHNMEHWKVGDGYGKNQANECALRRRPSHGLRPLLPSTQSDRSELDTRQHLRVPKKKTVESARSYRDTRTTPTWTQPQPSSRADSGAQRRRKDVAHAHHKDSAGKPAHSAPDVGAPPEAGPGGGRVRWAGLAPGSGVVSGLGCGPTPRDRGRSERREGQWHGVVQGGLGRARAANEL